LTDLDNYSRERKIKFRSSLRIAKLDKKQILSALRLAQFSDFKGVVEDYLRVVRKRYDGNLLSLINLQWHILADITFAEKTIQGLRKQKEAAQPDESTELIDREIYIYELFRNKLKDVGDAFAWKFFNYNRSIIYLLSDHQDSGFIQEGGISGELLTLLMKYYAEDELPILNCITNCIRFGDVVSKTKKGIFDIAEVKSGIRYAKKHGPRQLKAIDDVISFINNSRKQDGGKEWIILPLDFYPRNYFDKLANLISKANNIGYAFNKLNDYSYTTAINFEKVEETTDISDALDNQHGQFSEGWTGLSKGFSNYDRFEFSPIIAPYSIFPFSEKTCVDLMFGSICITTYINFNLLAEHFRESGLYVYETPEEIIEDNPEKLAQKMFTLGKGEFTLSLPPSMFTGLFFEFRHPNMIKKELLAVRDYLKPKQDPYTLTYNIQESKIWK
jgi:hypothetical protein